MLKHITSLFIYLFILSVYGVRETSAFARASNWRASETVLGVDNVKSGICYILVVRSNSTNAWRASKYIMSIGKDYL